MLTRTPEYKLNMNDPLDPALGKGMGHEYGVFGASTALVVVDPQLRFCTSAANRDNIESALDVIESARAHFNKRSLPVFIVYTAKPTGPDRLPPADEHVNGDNRLYRQSLTGVFELCSKWAQSAFREEEDGMFRITGETQLHRALKDDYPGVTNLVMTGFHYGLCVTETAQDALQLGYDVTIMTDGVANGYEHEMSAEQYRLNIAASSLVLRTQGAKLKTLSSIKRMYKP